MNKDTILAELIYNTNKFYISKVIKKLPIYIGDIQLWIEGRTSPIGRQNIQKLLSAYGINNKKSLVDISKSISLNDTFWIKNKEDKIFWEDISPYTNRLSKIASELSLGYLNNALIDIKSPSPEFNTDGSFRKCWKRVGGKVYMIKRGTEKYFKDHDIHGNEPYSEYYTCELAELLGISNLVSYKLGEYKDTLLVDGSKIKEVVSYCELFTSEDIGFVPMSMLNRHIDGGVSGLIQFFKVKHPLSVTWISEMILLDALSFNPDRHTGNYGVLVDNNTFEILRFAPIFDNNMALYPRLKLMDTTKAEILETINSTFPRTYVHNKNTFSDQAASVLTPELSHRLSSLRGFKFNRNKKLRLPEHRLRFLEQLINRQIEIILYKYKTTPKV